MFIGALIAPLLATCVAAEKRDLNPGEIAGLVENFKNAGLVDLVGGANFQPQGLLTGKFGDADWNVGSNFTAEQTRAFPSFFVNPNAGSDAFSNNASLFSTLLVDVGPVGSNASAQTLHWLINTIHVNTTGGAPYALNYDNGTTITEYAGPNPAQGSGPHRYVLGLFQQPEGFTAPQAYSQRNTPVGPFDLAKYLSDSKLGNLVAANYFTVENGQSTVSLSQTQPVQSSTLSGYTGAAAIPTAAGAAGGAGNSTAGGAAGGNGTAGAGGNGTDAGAGGAGASGASGSGAGGAGGASGTGSAAAGSSSAPAGGAGSGAQALLAPAVGVGAAVLGAVALVF